MTVQCREVCRDGLGSRFRSGSFQVNFRFQGKERTFTLGPVSQAEARRQGGPRRLPPPATQAGTRRASVRRRHRLVRRAGRQSGTGCESSLEPPGVRTSLGTLRDRYLATHAGAHEEKTLYTTRIHFKHSSRRSARAFPLSELTHASFQRAHQPPGAQPASRRSRSRKRSLRFEPPGIGAEGMSWSRPSGQVSGLVYRKTSEKPPFQTRDEIERQISQGRTDRGPEERTLGRALPAAGRGRRAAGGRPCRRGPSVDLPDGLHRGPHRGPALGADPDARRRRRFRRRR